MLVAKQNCQNEQKPYASMINVCLMKMKYFRIEVEVAVEPCHVSFLLLLLLLLLLLIYWYGWHSNDVYRLQSALHFMSQHRMKNTSMSVYACESINFA